MCEINVGFFPPFFVLNAFSIFFLPPSSDLGISPLLALYMGCAYSFTRRFEIG